MIYICVLNMMFALLYDNNLDYGDAETDQNITNTKPWLPTQVKTNGTKVEDCAKGNQVTSNQPTKSMKPVPQSQAIFYCWLVDSIVAPIFENNWLPSQI